MNMLLQFDSWLKNVQSPRVEELLKKAALKKDIISLAGGLPSEDLFPVSEFEKAFHNVIKNQVLEALQYTWAEGLDILREQISEYLKKKGIKAGPDEILITHGVQQALDLIGKLYLKPKDCIAIETPTYSAAINIFELQRVNFFCIRRDKNGLDINKLEKVFQEKKTKLFYITPTGHNPTGLSISLQQRKEIINLANKYNIIIIEDAAYGDLEYDNPQKPMKSLAHNENIIYTGSLSKILSPGIRIGWIVAPKKVIEQLILIKQASDLQTSSVNQLVISEYLSKNSLEKQIEKCIIFYSKNRNTMVKAIEENFPEEVEWIYPTSAYSVWAKFPKEFSVESILEGAINHKASFEPGSPFFPSSKKDNFMRLSFSNQTEESITEGIARLGKYLKTKL